MIVSFIVVLGEHFEACVCQDCPVRRRPKGQRLSTRGKIIPGARLLWRREQESPAPSQHARDATNKCPLCVVRQKEYQAPRQHAIECLAEERRVLDRLAYDMRAWETDTVGVRQGGRSIERVKREPSSREYL